MMMMMMMTILLFVRHYSEHEVYY
jgi:hypothetical protein